MSIEHPRVPTSYQYLCVDEVLDRVDGDLELLGELHQMFQDSWRDSWSSICRQVCNRNATESKEEFHSFKGTVGMLSTGSPFQLLQQLENLAGHARWAEIDLLIEPVSLQVAQLERETDLFLRECANELALSGEHTPLEQLV